MLISTSSYAKRYSNGGLYSTGRTLYLSCNYTTRGGCASNMRARVELRPRTCVLGHSCGYGTPLLFQSSQTWYRHGQRPRCERWQGRAESLFLPFGFHSLVVSHSVPQRTAAAAAAAAARLVVGDHHGTPEKDIVAIRVLICGS
jgi:hypothetical protein